MSHQQGLGECLGRETSEGSSDGSPAGPGGEESSIDTKSLSSLLNLLGFKKSHQPPYFEGPPPPPPLRPLTICWDCCLLDRGEWGVLKDLQNPL